LSSLPRMGGYVWVVCVRACVRVCVWCGMCYVLAVPVSFSFHHPPLQQFAKNRVAGALLNMVIPKTTHGAIIAGAGVPLLVALVNEVQENEALRQIWASTKGDAAGALMHLAANPDAQAVVREAGGIEAMVALLENREHMERATGKSGWMWNR